jgi:hypothetical protein
VACAPLDEFPAGPLDTDPGLAPLDELVPEDPVPGELVLVLPEVWAEPGSVAAMAPVASALATPTPAVTTDSRRLPRRLSTDGGSARPPGSLDIGGSFLVTRCWLHRHRGCGGQRKATFRAVLDSF